MRKVAGSEAEALLGEAKVSVSWVYEGKNDYIRDAEAATVFVLDGFNPLDPVDVGCARLAAAAPDLAYTVVELERALRWVEFVGPLLERENLTKPEQAAESAVCGYGTLLNQSIIQARRIPSGLAAEVRVESSILRLVVEGRRPPFDEETTRRICGLLKCDPQPLLDARAKALEVVHA